MLLELKVSHFAVIDSLQVYFLRPGLNVLTGETGAGKSILLKSLSLLLGGKATPDVIRVGNDHAVIEGAFDLSERPDIRKDLKELDLDSENELVVRRIISRSGKHRLYINGSLSTVNVLERILPRLVEITGQHEHHSLTKSSSQLSVLDNFADLLERRREYSALFSATQDLREQIEGLRASMRDRDQRIDFLRFQVNEIESFNPKPGEDQELSSHFQRAKFASRLHSFAQKAEEGLYSQERSIYSTLSDLVHEGEPLIELDSRLKSLVSSLKEASVLVEDAAFGFRDYSKSDEPDEKELERLEDRMSMFRKLQKKYGSTVEEMIRFRDSASQELEGLEKSDESLKDLENQLNENLKRLEALAADLHAKRSKAAKKLAIGINQELADLNMKGIEFSINVTLLPDLTTSGKDEILFLIKPSPKDEPRPISKIASGGELSRLMLAIKQVVSASDLPMTYLFDEVDTGVSGPTAEKVGRKLMTIGTEHQVICITHLPQVAAFADAHFLIAKEVSGGLVRSEIRELKEGERVQELGRMISGEKITQSSLSHAKEMLQTQRRKHPLASV